jgi:signal transduction histidine kinase
VATSVTPTGAIQISVGDTGHGIAEQDLTRIFDPFFTTKQGQGGTGLGLYVCRSIITEAGGDIGVSSQPGQGTTFRVTLPAAHTTRRKSDSKWAAVRDPNA